MPDPRSRPKEKLKLNMRTWLFAIALSLVAITTHAAVVISPPANPSRAETLAVRELQRYIYLRTGELPQISSRAASQRIRIAKSAKTLSPQQYQIKTTTVNGRKTWSIIGGDHAGVLYGTYAFIEKLGVRFYLHGDVIPDARLAKIPDINETGSPIFSIRGIQPFHDFSEGPDWWTTEDYLAYISQLPKMRMNFIGFHCYPEGMAELGVWIGQPSDVDERGQANFSYPAVWTNTKQGWGCVPMNTSDFTSGAGLLFPGDQYGPEAMNGVFPTPQDPKQNNDNFNRAGRMFGTAFSHARSLGVKTCIGTETPLTIPALVRERLKQQGKDPADPKVVTEVYEGMFQRISRAYPVDYYWLWTPEGWTWSANTADEIEKTKKDIRCALDALDSLGNPFTLATSGWVLGPVQDRALLDSVLPKQSPMSCINRTVGHAPVEPAFADITGRPKWAIPWLENDPVLTAPQPWVGRMRYDAADAKRFGCTGLLGIHWRTKVLSQNIAALAAAGWDQSWVPAGYCREKNDIKDGPMNGQIVTYGESIEGTDEDAVYQSVRFNVDGYRLAVPDGVYTITLKFCEVAYGEVGKRSFGVKLQGKQVIADLDVFAKAGKNKALDYSYPDIAVDKLLRIDFIRGAEFPCIAGMVIEGRTAAASPYVRKINCGGPKFNDYEADMTLPVDATDVRSMPVEAFYIDFARANFGSEVAVEAGKILAKIDGRGLPEPTGWLDGPGGVAPNRKPWAEVKTRYSFVQKLAALRPCVTGAGNRERFDYWLTTYRCMETLGQLGCLRGELDIKMEAIAAEKDPAKQKSLARQGVALRIRLSRLWEQMISQQLAAVDTPGEMGTIDNLERHSRGKLQFLTKHDEQLTKTLGTLLPKEIELSKRFTGPARIIVPTVRTQVKAGESMRLTVIVPDKELPSAAALHWRALGSSGYNKVALQHMGRATYEAKLPPASGPFEYYVTAQTKIAKLVWPATAPKTGQTVVVW